ncbi:MAG: hypothetical protein ABW158_10430 [Candidatus Thiodiazotropha sp. 6PDIVS]
MEKDKTTNPINVTFFSADAVVFDPTTITYLVEQTGLVGRPVSSLNYRPIFTGRYFNNKGLKVELNFTRQIYPFVTGQI